MTTTLPCIFCPASEAYEYHNLKTDKWSVYCPACTARSGAHDNEGEAVAEWERQLAVKEGYAKLLDEFEGVVPFLAAHGWYETMEKLEAAIANAEGNKPSYKNARGVIPWKEGDEPAEVTIRRQRNVEPPE